MSIYQTESGFIEMGTITHQGKEYTYNGAMINDHHIVAYIGPNNALQTWNGEEIGHVRITSSWSTPRSWISNRMYSYYIMLDDGRHYTGRGFGEGFSVTGKRTAKQLKRIKEQLEGEK